MKHSLRGGKPCRLLTPISLILFVFSMNLVSCMHTSISDVVRFVAERQVDTTNYVRRTVEVGNISAVEADCFADITYCQTAVGESAKIELLAPTDVLKNIKIWVDADNCLQISLRQSYHMPDNTVAVIRIHAPSINKFALYGGKCLRLGNIQTNSDINLSLEGAGMVQSTHIKASRINAKLNGAGIIDLSGLNVHDIHAELNGAGNIVLSGRAVNADTHINGAGTIDTNNLKK